MFNIGDRVKIIRGDVYNGCIGTIVRITRDITTRYHVSFGAGITIAYHGHNLEKVA